MKRLKPESFTGPRSYFTDFDHRIVARTVNLSQLRINAERKLKLLLLIKSKIICAASHLATEFAYDILKDNPRLLIEGHVVPALRKDKNNISELFERKKIDRKAEILGYYEQNMRYAVDWELEDNSGWFRDRFIEEISNPTSLIREQLSHLSTTPIPTTVINNIKKEISENRIISRSQIEHFAKELTSSQKELLYNFRELVYHLSGARVVNCESSLPQENYIDYDIADLKGKRTKLSDEQILFKLFIELAFETIQRRMIPFELLDWLSFDDILSIRKPILESDFQNKYDYLISRLVKGVKQDYNELFLNLNELEKIRNSLELTFKEVFEKELPHFLKKRAIKQAKELGSVGSSVALGALGFIPVIGQVASGVSVLKDSPALLFNVRQTLSSQKAVNDLGTYIQNKETLLRQKIEKAHLSEQAIMLEMVDLFSQTLGEKIKF
ncbi:MAG: hypothetical protein ACNYWU_01615 [Desulfobacterales bacterium]